MPGCLGNPAVITTTSESLISSKLEVPDSFACGEGWKAVMAGVWKYPDHITVLEAHALVKTIRRLAVSVFGKRLRQLCLVDNMAVVLAFNRSRAKNRKLLILIRRFCAYCLARDILVSIRWIPSERNTADKPSRLRYDFPGNPFSDSPDIYNNIIFFNRSFIIY